MQKAQRNAGLDETTFDNSYYFRIKKSAQRKGLEMIKNKTFFIQSFSLINNPNPSRVVEWFITQEKIRFQKTILKPTFNWGHK